MEEEIERGIESAIGAAHLRLAHKIIGLAIRDAKYRPAEVRQFLSSEGFVWLLWLIGYEPEDLQDIAGRIAMQAFGLR